MIPTAVAATCERFRGCVVTGNLRQHDATEARLDVGLPPERQSFNAGSVIGGRRSIGGSNIGGIRETQEMLDFCGEHGIGAVVETIAADEVTEACDRVVDGKVHYRYVIDTATIPA